MSFEKKLAKLKRDPKAFFADAISKRVIPISSTLRKIKPKQKQGYEKYVIISAVYNVEKYLDEFLISLLKQRLDFKNNIHVILVDDGSTDSSASIIKKYQEKFPNNITYLYKQNGGQASARNLGLEYLKNSNIKAGWVNFADPDDFLDREFFAYVDSTLKKHKNKDIIMLSCNLIPFYEDKNAFVDNHPLNFRFKQDKVFDEDYLNSNFIQLSASSALFCVKSIKNLKSKVVFKEGISKFEDAFFLNHLLLYYPTKTKIFLKNAKYYYRKRADKSSSLDKAGDITDKQLLESGYLILLLLLCKQILPFIPKNLQHVCIYDTAWLIKRVVDTKQNLEQKDCDEIYKIFTEIFSYIDAENILNFNTMQKNGFWYFYKFGIISCFKNQEPTTYISYIKDIDPIKNQICISYFCKNFNDEANFCLNYQIIKPNLIKTIEHKFLNEVFCYEKIVWLNSKSDSVLAVYLNEKQVKITLKGKQKFSIKTNEIFQAFSYNDKNNCWIIMDKDIDADDNAEHFYRYLKSINCNKEFYFALRNTSKDYARLKNEGFNIIEFESQRFKDLAKKASLIISSHTDNYFLQFFKHSRFVFLQHGVTKDDLHNWLNSKNISLFITATKNEHNSLAENKNYVYKFTSKQVVLTGLARHDSLLAKNKANQKQILLMPTWRKYLVGGLKGNSNQRIILENEFIQSEYFRAFSQLLNSARLKELCSKFGYKIVFNVHPNMRDYLHLFDVGEFVHFADANVSLQELFANCDMMISDYSSVAFEMAYLGKPVLYYQFDEEEIFANHIYQKGYFSYRENGFGAVCTDEQSLLDELEILLKNSCAPSGRYKDNINNTFMFKDGKCCQRIYEAIMEMDGE